MARLSAKTVLASSNETPCLRRLSRALAGSHSKRMSSTSYYMYNVCITQATRGCCITRIGQRGMMLWPSNHCVPPPTYPHVRAARSPPQVVTPRGLHETPVHDAAPG